MSVEIIYRSGQRLIGKREGDTDTQNPVINVFAADLRRIGVPVRLLSYLARDPYAEPVEPYVVDAPFLDIQTEG